MDREAKIQQLEQLLSELKTAAPSSLEDKLKRFEDHILHRFNASEVQMTNQLEDHVVALAFCIITFTFVAFYVFYHVILQTLNANRCKCAQELKDWSLVVKASNLLLGQPTALGPS